MLDNLKPMVVILAVAWPGFALVRPMCLAFMSAAVFARRRNIWFFLTVVAFLSPSFGIYIVITAIVLLRELGREENPLALFLWTLFVIPNTRFFIPTIIINNLFDLTQYRMLTFILVLPFINRWFRNRRADSGGGFNLFDGLLLAFLGLQIVLRLSVQSTTESMREGFLLLLDSFVVFYAFSRIDNRRQLNDVLACFFVSSFIMALIASVEWLRGWLLYDGLSTGWGDPTMFGYLLRGDRIRAHAAVGNSLGLGWQLASALALYMYLRMAVVSKTRDKVIAALLCFGLFATGSRGPWLTALLGVFVFFSMRPGALKKMPGVVLGAALLIGVMYMTPLRESILDRLPIIGNTDQDTIEYRQQLAQLSWRLIWQHPFFGDPFVTAKMEELRQGQGIIDIVNGYLFTLLFTGWVGMALQGGLFLTALLSGIRGCLGARALSPDLQASGAAIVGCFFGCLLFIAVAGHGPLTLMVVGLLVSYTKLVKLEGAAGFTSSEIERTAHRYASPASLRPTSG